MAVFSNGDMQMTGWIEYLLYYIFILILQLSITICFDISSSFIFPFGLFVCKNLLVLLMKGHFPKIVIILFI